MKFFNRKFFGITQGEVVIALIVMSLVILASKNITDSKINYAKRVRTYAAWNNLSSIASAIVGDGVRVEDEYTYKMISPVYKTTGQGAYLPDIQDANGQPSVHIYGGFYDKLIEHFNVLDSEAGPTFVCNGCGTKGFFENVTPTVFLSNGMTLFISPVSYSFAMSDVAITPMVDATFVRALKCLNGLPSSVTGDATCNRVSEINTFCSPIEIKSAPITPGSTTFSGNTTIYFKNISECPHCSNVATPVKKFGPIPIFEYFHVLFKSLKTSTACGPVSEAFLNESFSRFLAGSYYIVFVDTDGPRSGTNTLNDDVMEFYILLNGEVLPVSPKMRQGDFLLANLFSTDETGKRTILSSGLSLPKAMCNYRLGATPSYYSTDFVPIRNYCPTGSASCNSTHGCDYVPIRANVSIRGRGIN